MKGAVAVEQNATLHLGNAGTYNYNPTYEIDQGNVYVDNTISVYGGNIVIDSNVKLTDIAGEGVPGILNLSAGGAAATITATTSVTLTNGILIKGQGTIGDGSNLLLVNEGTIDSNLAGTVLSIELDDTPHTGTTGTNSGLMEATTGGDLTITTGDRGYATFANTGKLEAFAGSTVDMFRVDLTNLVNDVLTGGTWEASGAGSNLTFDSGDVFTSDAATLILSGAGSVIDDAGTTLESELTDIATGGTLEVLASRGYTTSHALRLEGTLQLGGGTFTSGAITGASGASLTGFGTFASAVTTSGGVTATGGTLTFTGTDTFSGALSGGGGITFSKDKVTLGKGAALAAQQIILSSANLSLTTSFTYVATLAGGTTKTLFSETASTIAFASSGLYLALGGTTTLAGGSETGAGGILSLTGTATSSGFTVAGGATLTVRGSLDVTSGALTLGSKPTSGAAAAGTLGIKAGGVLQLTGTASIGIAAGATGAFANAGTLEKLENGGIAKVTAAIANTGTLLVANGTLDLTGAVSGAGTARIESGGTLEFDAAATGAVSFAAGGGTLKLGPAASFKGSVASLGAGDTVDVGGFGIKTTFTYTANAQNTGGTLKLIDGSKTNSLTLVGSYVTGGFHLTNGSTDTAITYAAPVAAPKVASHAHALTAALFEAAFAPASSGTAFDHAADLHATAAIFAVAAHAGSAAPAHHAMWG